MGKHVHKDAPERSVRITEIEAYEDRLQALDTERALVLIERNKLVREMFHEGWTLADIGDLLGVIRQRVHEIVHADAIDRSDRRRLLREQKEHAIRTDQF